MTSTLFLPGLVTEPVFLKSCRIRINVKLNFSLWLIKDQIRPQHELLQLFTVLKCWVRRTDIFLTSKSKVLRQMSVKLEFVSWQSVWCPLASMATSSRESGCGRAWPPIVSYTTPLKLHKTYLSFLFRPSNLVSLQPHIRISLIHKSIILQIHVFFLLS